MNPLIFAMTIAAAGLLHVQHCILPEGVTSIQDRSQLPRALREKFEEVAMPGEAPTVKYTEQSELIWWRGTRWVSLEGRGDYASRHVVAFEVGSDGLTAREIPISNPADPPASLCQLATLYLNPNRVD